MTRRAVRDPIGQRGYVGSKFFHGQSSETRPDNRGKPSGRSHMPRNPPALSAAGIATAVTVVL